MIGELSAYTAESYNDCFKDDKTDTKIRIGFLSHYKTSKVSKNLRNKEIFHIHQH